MDPSHNAKPRKNSIERGAMLNDEKESATSINFRDRLYVDLYVFGRADLCNGIAICLKPVQANVPAKNSTLSCTFSKAST